MSKNRNFNNYYQKKKPKKNSRRSRNGTLQVESLVDSDQLNKKKTESDTNSGQVLSDSSANRYLKGNMFGSLLEESVSLDTFVQKDEPNLCSSTNDAKLDFGVISDKSKQNNNRGYGNPKSVDSTVTLNSKSFETDDDAATIFFKSLLAKGKSNSPETLNPAKIATGPIYHFNSQTKSSNAQPKQQAESKNNFSPRSKTKRFNQKRNRSAENKSKRPLEDFQKSSPAKPSHFDHVDLKAIKAKQFGNVESTATINNNKTETENNTQRNVSKKLNCPIELIDGKEDLASTVQNQQNALLHLPSSDKVDSQINSSSLKPLNSLEMDIPLRDPAVIFYQTAIPSNDSDSASLHPCHYQHVSHGPTCHELMSLLSADVSQSETPSSITKKDHTHENKLESEPMNFETSDEIIDKSCSSSDSIEENLPENNSIVITSNTAGSVIPSLSNKIGVQNKQIKQNTKSTNDSEKATASCATFENGSTQCVDSITPATPQSRTSSENNKNMETSSCTKTQRSPEITDQLPGSPELEQPTTPETSYANTTPKTSPYTPNPKATPFTPRRNFNSFSPSPYNPYDFYGNDMPGYYPSWGPCNFPNVNGYFDNYPQEMFKPHHYNPYFEFKPPKARKFNGKLHTTNKSFENDKVKKKAPQQSTSQEPENKSAAVSTSVPDSCLTEPTWKNDETSEKSFKELLPAPIIVDTEKANLNKKQDVYYHSSNKESPEMRFEPMMSNVYDPYFMKHGHFNPPRYPMPDFPFCDNFAGPPGLFYGPPQFGDHSFHPFNQYCPPFPFHYPEPQFHNYEYGLHENHQQC